MSKAFDRINHRKLINKLRNYGCGGSLLKWFTSYLTGRRQRVTVLGATSNTLPISSGVPQGSILRPVLFLLYVNDLPDSVTTSQVAMFADDTKLFSAIKCQMSITIINCGMPDAQFFRTLWHKPLIPTIGYTIVNREEGLEAGGVAKLCYCSMSRDNTSALKANSVI